MAVTELMRATADAQASRARAEADLHEQKEKLTDERRTVTDPLRREARTNHFAQLAINTFRGEL